MKFSRQRVQHFIFFVDLVILFSSIFLALLLRNFDVPSLVMVIGHFKFFNIMIFSWIFLMYLMNIYSIDKYIPVDQLFIRFFIIALFSTLLGFSTYYIFHDNITPKTVLLFYNAIVLILVLIWHEGVRKFFSSKLLNTKVIFIGYNDNVKELISDLNVRCYGKFTSCGIYDTDKDASTLKTFSELEKTIKDENISTFVISNSYILSKELTELLFNKLEQGATFYYLPEFYELTKRRIPLGSINEGWVLQQINLRGKIFYNIIKRLTDIVAALILLTCSILFWPLIALIIKIESKGPVFFVQTRTGMHGKNFNLLKFRTMRTKNNTFAYTTANDNRITKFGNFMRKCRIDELPQMLNVLFGDMSLIGPRPERPEYIEELQKVIPYYRQRLIVKPGITGWDQVSGEYHSPSVEDTYKKLQNDLYYIKNRSVALDISIAVKTVGTMLMREGV